MKLSSKIAVGASMLASLAIGTLDANAGVTVGVAIGAPVVKVRVGNPCFRPYRFRPAYCAYREIHPDPTCPRIQWIRAHQHREAIPAQP